MKKLSIVLLLLLNGFALQAQQEFFLLLGTEAAEAGYALTVTEDEGCAVAGLTGGDVLLTRHDGAGELLWARAFSGGEADEPAQAIVQTPDGGFALLGPVFDYDGGFGALQLLRTDADGNLLWARRFPGAFIDGGVSLRLTPDGGFILGGSADRNDNTDALIVKTDSEGQVQWSRFIGGAGQETCYSLELTNDGGYVFTGEQSSFSGGVTPWIVRLGADGSVRWARVLEGAAGAALHTIRRTEGGFAALGHAASDRGDDLDLLLVRLDENGNPIWGRTFGSPATERSGGLTLTTGRSFFVLGHTSGAGNGEADLFLFIVDLGGDYLASYTLGLPGDDLSPTGGDRPAAQLLTDGSFLLTGQQRGRNFGENDLLLARTQLLAGPLCGLEGWLPDISVRTLLARSVTPGTVAGPAATDITLSSRPVPLEYHIRCTPPVAAFGVSDSLLCAGECLQVTDSSSNFPDTWEWSFPGADPAQAEGQQPPDICFATPGTYTLMLIVANDYGADTTRQTIRVVPQPTLTITGDTAICPGETTTLTAVTDPGASLVWDDGSTAPERRPDAAGIFWAEATKEGCVVRDSVEVLQEDCPCELAIPNAFTPNGDGSNDRFRLLINCPVEDFRMRVYSRWGKVVYDSSDLDEGWDGRYDGQPLPSEVYIYVVDVRYLDNGVPVEEGLRGDVTLIR